MNNLTLLQPFPPEAMMQRTELSRARRMLRKLDRISQQWRLDEKLPKVQQQGYETFSKRRTPILDDMDAMAAEVWNREVGLERFSVVHVQRGDSDYRLQLLSFSFDNALSWGGQWSWHFEGRALRKDGTLGRKSMSVGFRFTRLERRHLDGVWRELHWLEEETT